ncbi:hypothetical protein ABZ725_51195 [Streptomyces sp. NPDC006872]
MPHGAAVEELTAETTTQPPHDPTRLKTTALTEPARTEPQARPTSATPAP